MRRRRLVAVLAILAALLGAPSMASGAETVFTLAVDYDGRLAATGVREDAAAAERGLVEDGLLGLVLLVGLSGIAAVAIIGTALVLAGRRRSERADDADRAPPDEAATDAVLERRALRQAKVRLTEDPIVAAMGIDEDPPRGRRRGGGRGRSGTAS